MDQQRAKQIREALKKLDVSNDEHWTADGQPRLAAVPGLTRTELVQVAPHFTRTNPSFELPPAIERKRKADEELRKLDEEQRALEKKRKEALALGDSAISELDKPVTPQDLSKNIRTYHQRMFEHELEEARSRQAIEQQMKTLLPPPPSPLDNAIAKEATRQERQQAVHEYERRGA
jgi:hypothetical protein